MINLTLLILNRKIIKTSPTNKNMESAKRITRREAKEIVDSVLGNNRTFHWKFSLLRIIISDDSLKEHMETLSGR